MSGGVSHSTIIHTKTNAGKRYDLAKVERRKKRASQCIGCDHNDKGFCRDLKNWCFNSQPYCPKCVQTVQNYQYNKQVCGKARKKKSKNKF